MSRSVRSSPETGTHAVLVVGLGNPGVRYAQTRHNVGFMVLDRLAVAWRAAWQEDPSPAAVGHAQVAGRSVFLLKPLTYMNNSGHAVRLALARLHLTPQEVVLVYDDLDLPLGRLRIRRQGSAGGHRGVASVIRELGTEEFGRVRVGIGRPPDGVTAADYVLEPFPPGERDAARKALERACAAVAAIIADGFEAAMRLFNS